MVALDFPRVPVSVPLVSRSESLLDPKPATATEQVSPVVPNFELTNQPPVVEFSAKPLPAVADNRQAERLDQALVVPTLLPPTAPASLTASPAEAILDTWPEMSHWLDMLEPVPVSAGFDGDNVDLVELVLFGVLTGAAAAIGGVRREDAKLPELRSVRPE